LRKLLFFTLLLTFIFAACEQSPEQEPKEENYQKHLKQYLSQEPIIQSDGTMIFYCAPLVMSGTIEALKDKYVDAKCIYAQLPKQADGSILPDAIMDDFSTYGVSSSFSFIGHGLESLEKKTNTITNALKSGNTVLCIVETTFKPTGEKMPHYYLILGYKKDMKNNITFFVYDSYLNQEPNNPLITIDTNGNNAGNMSINPVELFAKAALINYGLVNTFWMVNSVK